jgi:hypothetical protein
MQRERSALRISDDSEASDSWDIGRFLVYRAAQLLRKGRFFVDAADLDVGHPVRGHAHSYRFSGEFHDATERALTAHPHDIVVISTFPNA